MKQRFERRSNRPGPRLGWLGSMLWAGVWAVFLPAWLSNPSQAQGAEVDYLREVKPLLQARCYACHGALKQESNLRLDTGPQARDGGDSGPAIEPGRPDDSLLLTRVAAADPDERMPPEGEPLTVQQIETLRRWIEQGAKSPEGEQPEEDPRDHWAFRPPVRPSLPPVPGAASRETTSPGNPIDAFVDARLAQAKLTPRPPAPKANLLRRVYLDLIGLPPTRDELQAFLADDRPDAYERVVARLLDDPRYGERWGRHWMDIWRYSDWYGRRYVNDVRNSASQIFRWRDWIVRSLNEGKGYDRMVQEMLAADEISPDDYEAGVATGYLIRNYYSLNPNEWMRSTVEHTGKAFLGLTFNCAHCHDHKYDPIAHDDYFRLRAFFEPIYIRQDRVPGEADPGIFEDYSYGGTRKVQRLGAVRVYDKEPEAPTWFYTGGDERNRLEDRGSIAPGVPAFLGADRLQIEPVQLPPIAWYPGMRPEIQATMRADVEQRVKQAEDRLATARASGPQVPEPLIEELAQAEAAYSQAVQEAQADGRPGALSGQQSLLLDATAGRRIVQNGLKTLETLEDGVTLEFELLILKDAHVNFQFARDIKQGLTAGYLGFREGRIVAYQPGSFTEFDAGRYDFEAGQHRFHVSLLLQTEADRCLVTVRSTTDGSILVDAVPMALNGWNPVGDPTKAITFDARTGSVAVVDDVTLSKAASNLGPAEPLIRFDFESPTYEAGRDIEGLEGWMLSASCMAPATSVVSRTAGNPDLRAFVDRLHQAQQAVRSGRLKVEAAESELAAARAQQASLEARIKAELVRYGEGCDSEVDATARVARQLEREAALAEATAEVLEAELALQNAQAKEPDDAERDKAIQTATKRLAAANTAATKARAQAAENTEPSGDDDDPAAGGYAPLSPQYPRESTGRRRALALWITRRDNPLTARVAVNHIWTRHFHAPLVASMYDFGRNGDFPTHPELLDWLAVEFMESKWNMKHLHRLIVTSQTYRRESSVGDQVANVEADPENALLWRMNPGRMEAEVVRDSLLYCAGKLDSTMGGVELENKEALTTYRRSLYYSVYPEAGGESELGKLFDAPDPLECYRRTTSVVPQQALALTNSQLIHDSSIAIVRSWQPSPVGVDDEAAFIGAMFQRILSRDPSSDERRVCEDILARQRQLAASPESSEAATAARESLVRILLNHNDFLTIR